MRPKNDLKVSKSGDFARQFQQGSSAHTPGCDICGLSHDTEECPLISSGVRVEDTSLPKKAFLTLPTGLEYKHLADGSYDVVSTRCLYKGTQFGPLDAPKILHFNAECQYKLKIFKGNKTICFLDTTDFNKCNWMVLVKFTEDLGVRNCICYQLRNEIYFSVVSEISSGQSLIVAYSPGYLTQLKNSGVEDKALCEPLEAETKLFPLLEPSSSTKRCFKYDNEFVSEPEDNHSEEKETLSQEFIDHDYLVPLPHSEGTTQKETDLEKKSRKRKIGLETSVKDSNLRKSLRKRTLPVKFEVDIDFHNKQYIRENDESSEQYDSSDGNDATCEEFSNRSKGRRVYAVRAKDSWNCRFCHKISTTIESFANHLIEHYKKVGAARTEKGRLSKLRLGRTEKIPKELDPKVVLVRIDEGKTHLDTLIDKSKDMAISKTKIQKKTEYLGEPSDSKIKTEPSYPYSCDICIHQKIFNRAEYVIRHLRLHTNELFCFNCSQKFSAREELSTHNCVQTKKGEKQFVCASCEESFSSNFELKQHMFLHEKSLRCIRCRRFFKTGEELKNHVCFLKRKSNYTSEREKIALLLKCEICNEMFSKPQTFEKHIKSHEPSAFTCSVCSKVLSNETLKMHTSICKVLQRFLDRDCEDLICPGYKCTKSFKDLQNFKDHMASHTHPFMCPTCYVRMKTALDINSHVCEALSCDGCESTFPNLIELKNHITNQHGGSKSYCFECVFPFVSADGYVQHGDCELKRALLSKLPEKIGKSSKPQNDGNFICEICGATYTKWTSMKTHKYTHGPKKFSCDKCGKNFHRRELLIDHMYVHEDAQFECKSCRKRFKSKKSLDVHMRIHNGIKPYKCPVCDRSFTQRVNMKSHELIHLPQDLKGYSCTFEDCQKRFASKEYLKFHIESHEKGKNYACDVCDKRFIRMHMLNQHKRTAHGNHKYRCEFCNPNLFVRQKHSLFRHLQKRHPSFQNIWREEGYVEKVFIPGDGNFTHPSAKHRMTNTVYNEEISVSKEGEHILDDDNEDMNNAMISDSIVDTGGDVEIETEVVCGPGPDKMKDRFVVEDQKDNLRSTNLMLIQLDTGRYVIACPLQKTEGTGFLVEQIVPFE